MKFAAFAFALLAGTVPALSGTPLTVDADHTQFVTLSTDPGAIVVGNPSIADVSLNGRLLFINGHAYGETNLMVFDTAGGKIADYDISVSHGSANEVTMFIGSSTGPTSRYTFTCAPNCEAAIMPGDNSAWFGAIAADEQRKAQLAQGIKATDQAQRGGSQGGAPQGQ
jgi:hypothetical protein